MKSLVKQTADAPLDLDDIEALNRKLSQTKAEDLKSIWEDFNKEKLGDKKNTAAWVVAQMVLTQWASKSGKAACEALLDTSADDAFVQDAYPRVMNAWANNVPLKAGQWYVDSGITEKRNAKSLDAGSAFTSKVFRQLQLANADTTVKEIEKLRHTNEIVGAVEGLYEANKKLSGDLDKLSKDLKEIKNKPEVIHATEHILEAKDAAAEAAAKIKDPKQRIEFNKAMESRLRE